MTASQVLTEALSLEPGEAGYGVEVDESWVFDGRVFGGYVVALAGTAAGRETDHPLVRSAHAVFAQAVEPGEIAFAVEPLRSGRQASAVRVVARQAGRVVASAHFWFVSADSEGGAHGGERRGPVPPPLECPPLPWVTQFVPFMRFFEERAIDYPLSVERFHDGKPFADLWARLEAPSPDAPPLVAQMSDVMLLDAHLLDGVARQRGLTVGGASLDLSVHWLGAGRAGDWARIRTEAELTGSLVAASAAVYSEAGAPRAAASSQALILRW